MSDEDKLIKLVDNVNDARFWTPEMTLEDELNRVRSGERKASKILILFLDDEDEQYRVGYAQARMSSSQMLALMEVVKNMIIHEMWEEEYD